MKKDWCIDIQLLESTCSEAKQLKYYIKGQGRENDPIMLVAVGLYCIFCKKKKKKTSFGMFWSQENFCGYTVHLAKSFISLQNCIPYL